MIQEYQGMRRRANSRGGQFPPHFPQSNVIGSNTSSSSEYYSNFHLRYKIYGNQKLRDTRIPIPKFAPFRLRTILLVSLFLFAVKGIFFTIDHVLSKTGVMFKMEDGSRRILSPDQMKSGTVTATKTSSFAVIINTYRRPDLLKHALVHYAQKCGISAGVSQVFVVWADQSSEPPMIEEILPDIPKQKVGHLRSSTSSSGDESLGSGSGNYQKNAFPSVEFVRVKKDSLNSRFLPIENLETKAIFMVDDDVKVDCPSLRAGFEAWTYHPNAMVGYYPRLAFASSKKGISQLDSKSHRIYHTWPVVYAQHRFNMILTKASFFHSKYLDMYHDNDRNPREVLEYVDQNKNCEDIAMAFLVARNTKKSVEIDMETSRYCRDCPVFTSGKVMDSGLFSGISRGSSISPKGHMDARSSCIDAITSIYENRGWEYPLSDVNLGDQSWNHHYFWWQYTPSNLFEWFSIGNLL